MTEAVIFAPTHPLKTAVLFLVFNRPDTTKQVFESIRKAKPPRLYVAADGPRSTKEGEAETVQTVRDYVMKRIDWECEVKVLFREENLGCKYAVSSAITWFFENEEMGIILEDDCLPSQSFFWFCEELLVRYRDDTRIMAVSGDNFQFGRTRAEYSYYFSRYSHVWGWATWRRAWMNYDVDMRAWPEIKAGGWLYDLFGNLSEVEYWQRIIDKVYSGQIDTWDHQWTFACWINNGLAVLPRTNLVTNVGFNADATHTFGDSIFSNMSSEDIQFPLVHPTYIMRDAVADVYTKEVMFMRPLWKRAASKIIKLVRNK